MVAWKMLKSGLRSTSGMQLRRLERAMIEGRRWPESEFRSLLVSHPLLSMAVRGLVWGVYGTTRKRRLGATFRIDNSDCLRAADGSSMDLDENSVVGIPHPLEFEAESGDWASVFASAGQRQPFPQLVRKVYRETDPEGENLFGIKGMRINTGAIRGLMANGWSVRDAIGGQAYEFSRRFSSGVVTLSFEEGIYIGARYVEQSATQRLEDVTLPLRVEPIEFSELVRQLLAMRA